MDYIDARVLLSRQEQLDGKDAVEILNSWRSNPENYYKLLQTKGAAVPLREFKGYSQADEEYIFEETDKLILSPTLALKFFELESDDLNLVLFETLNYLTFNVPSDEENNDYEEDEEYDNQEEYAGQEDDAEDTSGFYAWPYLVGGCVYHLSADIIENVLFDWNYVFDWQFDSLGSIYNVLYKKLLNGDKCCDMLAVNSFNLFNWINHDEIDVDVRAKHYCFANYSLDLDEVGADAYFRKCLVHYLGAFWNEMADIVTHIEYQRISRCN